MTATLCVLHFSVLIAIGWLGVRVMRAFGPPGLVLSTSRVLLICAIVLPVLPKVLFDTLPDLRFADVSGRWTRLVAEQAPSGFNGRSNSVFNAPIQNFGPRNFPAMDLKRFLALLAILRALFLLARAFRLRRDLRRCTPIRKLGRVRIVVCERAVIPFSARLFGLAYVVVPQNILVEPHYLRVCVAHELQHHRQRDCQWAWLTGFLVAFFFWHPAFKAWVREMDQLQEFACDAFLIGRRKVSAQLYGRCLIWAAELGMAPPPCTAGMATVSSSFLRRRILMITTTRRTEKKIKRGLWIATSTIAVGAMAVFSVGARADRTREALTIADLERVARREPVATEFKQTVNPMVLDWMNWFRQNEEAREQLKTGLTRMPQYEALVTRKLKQYGLPLELRALPLIESGYRNFKAFAKEPVLVPGALRGAGIWMFVPKTAEHFGLFVSESAEGPDDRLDVERETDAAMQYLTKLRNDFHGDWDLAVAGYNHGEDYIHGQIAETGISDAWTLARMQKINDYLSKTVVASLILKAPELLD